MNTIISKIYTLIHETDNLIDFEDSVRTLILQLTTLSHPVKIKTQVNFRDGDGRSHLTKHMPAGEPEDLC